MLPTHPTARHRRAPPVRAPVAAVEPAEIVEARRAALLGGGSDRIARQHADGKLTARERLDLLLDPRSFSEVDLFALAVAAPRALPARSAPGDGVVAGFGRVDGREVAVVSQDFTVLGGSLGAGTARKVCKVLDQAGRTGVPVIFLNDSGGARIQEGVASLGGYGDIFARNVALSGVVPQLSVILGPCAGGAVYSPALTDFVLMSRGTSHMFVTGPDVVKTVLGEDVPLDALGGAEVHARESGVAHLVGASEEETLHLVRRILSYLPSNHLDEPPRGAPASTVQGRDPALDEIVPADPSQTYDARRVLERIADPGSVLEISPEFAPNLLVAFGRMDGWPVGFLANQPSHLAGVLDRRACEKGARFVRTCDAFHLPVISLVDVPGFMPGRGEEHGGIIRHGAKLLYAYVEATVPKLTVITRKAYGGAYIVMCSKHLGADVNLAWPRAEIAVLGAPAAVQILHRREIASAGDPARTRGALEEEYRERFGNPFQAAELGYVDDVIEPGETRAHLLRHLSRLRTKSVPVPDRKHGNIPL